MAKQRDEMVFLKDYQPFAYSIPHLDMEVDIAPQVARITTILDIAPREGTAPGTPLDLDGDGLTLKSVAIDGIDLTPGDYEEGGGSLTIKAPPAKPFKLTTVITINPEQNTRLMGLYRSGGVWCTQCEAEGFRRITFMADRPDVLATYRVKIIAPQADAPVLLANGNLLEQGDLDNGRHFAVWEDPFPKPTYLFALVAGDLGKIQDSFTTMSGREVALGIYCEHGKEDSCTYAMDSLKRAMKWDEVRFGREYDLDLFNIVAVSDFNFGAMENKGLNIFNDKLILAQPETATDADYGRIESVVAHEYFHNWTGDRVTCRDWFQLCLKEGLTVYRDQEFTSDERSRAVKRIEDVRDLRALQFPEDEGPLAHAPRPDQFREINNFYTATVYDKGAEVVRMLATLLGRDEFRKGTDLYFERHDGEATTIESWLQAFEDATRRDLSQFSIWYTQAGTPELSAAGVWNEDTRSFRLTLKQHTAPTPGQQNKQTLVMPIRFGLVGPNGEDMDVGEVSGGTVDGDLILLDGESATLEFSGLSARPVPSLLRGFSAPVKLTTNLSRDERFFLARHDKDSFNRWQALEDVAIEMLTKAVRGDGTLDDDDVTALASALGETLESASADNAFKALALTLPGEGSVGRALGNNIDPQKIHDVCSALKKAIGRSLTAPLLAAYDGLGDIAAKPDQGSQSVHARALRNQCLSLLVVSGAPEQARRAADQYHTARTMTDRMAALAASVMAWTDEAQTLLDDFGTRYAADPLIRDKWLTMTAARPDEGVLARVREIYQDTAFPKTNPNRMRALIGGFAMGNPAQFTRSDGEGFAFIAGVCRQADGTNQQLAARLLTAFRTWRTLEPVRQDKARAVLTDLAESPALSRDVSDILNRMLAE